MVHTTLRRLEVFVSAVEAGGFRACSDRLEISQAAVSNHVKQLEAELGYPLFLRRRGAVAGVTERGVAAYRKAKELLEDASGLAERAVAAAPRRLRIQTAPVLDSQLAERITDYMALDRACEIELQQSHFERMVEAYGRGDLDLAYFYSCGALPEMASTFCWSEPVAICARLDHPVHRLGPVSLEEACAFPMIASPAGCHFRRTVDEMLRRNGVQAFPVALEVNNCYMAREAVIKGLGVAPVITRYMEAELARFGIAPVPLRDVELALDVRRAVQPTFRFDPQVGRLIDHLERRPAQERPERPSAAALAEAMA